MIGWRIFRKGDQCQGQEVIDEHQKLLSRGEKLQKPLLQSGWIKNIVNEFVVELLAIMDHLLQLKHRESQDLLENQV